MERHGAKARHTPPLKPVEADWISEMPGRLRINLRPTLILP